jgi:hypothetical protein
MQKCCGIAARVAALHKELGKYPECTPEHFGGKRWTAGYTAGL